MNDAHLKLACQSSFQRAMAIVLLLLLLVFLMPTQAFAAENTAPDESSVATVSESVDESGEPCVEASEPVDGMKLVSDGAPASMVLAADQWVLGDNCTATLDAGVLTIGATVLGSPAAIDSRSVAADWPWDAQRGSIIRVVFADPVAAEEGLTSMFESMTLLGQIDGLSKFDTSSATNMASLFAHCEALTSLDLTGFSTENAVNISNMFRGCTSLTYLDLSSFDLSQVTTMQQAFDSCNALTGIRFSSAIDTSNVEDMDSLFAHCWALQSIDLSAFSTESLTEMDNMFRDCQSLGSLDLSTFTTSIDTGMQDAFLDCANLVQLTLGAGFGFGHGEDPYPPTHSGTTTAGFFTGAWVSTDGTVYASDEIPSNVADTYKAQIIPVTLSIEGDDLSVGATLESALVNSEGQVFSYQWARGDSATGSFTDIAGATTPDYVATDADAGKYLRCTATFDNIIASDIVGPVQAEPAPPTPPTPSKPVAPTAVTTPGGSGLPQAGDSDNLALVTGLVLASSTALLLALFRLKEKKNRT